MGGILKKIIKDSQQGKKSLALLLDPDEYHNESLKNLFSVDFKHVSYLFVGGSLLKKESLDELIGSLKTINSKPVILFPGNSGHISDKADAILFLSLISGRNPDYLIGQQVISAPIIKKSKIEVLPTAYMLIDGGRPTTVQYMSNTMPIPADKPDIAACTALAGQYLGLKITYLDAGSGAENPIAQNIITAVKNEIKGPLIVGGGIRNYEQMENAFDAGADIVVIGNALQNNEVSLEELNSGYLK